MKWVMAIAAGLGALWVLVSGFFGNKWKGRANDTLDEAEDRALEMLDAEALRDREHVLEALERTRGLSSDDRLHLALIRARIRRAEYDASGD